VPRTYSANRLVEDTRLIAKTISAGILLFCCMPCFAETCDSLSQQNLDLYTELVGLNKKVSSDDPCSHTSILRIQATIHKQVAANQMRALNANCPGVTAHGVSNEQVYAEQATSFSNSEKESCDKKKNQKAEEKPVPDPGQGVSSGGLVGSYDLRYDERSTEDSTKHSPTEPSVTRSKAPTITGKIFGDTPVGPESSGVTTAK
jgi:hypothetical protein